MATEMPNFKFCVDTLIQMNREWMLRNKKVHRKLLDGWIVKGCLNRRNTGILFF